MAIVTCHTEDCASSGRPIELATTYPDIATGQMQTVDVVMCGACGQQITDVAEDGDT